jgi:hypothetical protein
MLDSNEATDLTVPDDEFPGVVSNEVKKVAAVKAFEALRVHGNGGIERNLYAAASIAALKAAGLPRGEFSRFCTNELLISSTYRARLLRLDEVRDHVREALDWAQTQKHRLAECQSVQNLIKVVNDWRNKDRPLESKLDLDTQQGRRGKKLVADLEGVILQTAALVQERDETISEQALQVASQDEVIAHLRRCLAEDEADFATLRDRIPDEARDQALDALTSSRESAADDLAAIAKRYHWRPKDLRRELENCTAVEFSEA